MEAATTICSQLHPFTNLLCCLCCPLPLLQAEVTTGRVAMLGFTGLILWEVYFKGPFFPHLF